MAGRKKKTTSVLGDDPLSWLGKGGAQEKQHDQAGAPPPPTPTHTETTDADQNIAADVTRQDDSQEPVSIILDPVITLAEVSQLRETLLQQVGARQIHVDASKVEHIDTAGLQLLLAFSKTVQKQGGKLSWAGWSAACSGTAELLGLTKAAGIDDN